MEKNYITKQNSLWSFSVDFHFKTHTHMTVSLADVEGKERKSSCQERRKRTHVPAQTQAVIMAWRKDSFCKTSHS